MPIHHEHTHIQKQIQTHIAIHEINQNGVLCLFYRKRKCDKMPEGNNLYHLFGFHCYKGSYKCLFCVMSCHGDQ